MSCKNNRSIVCGGSWANSVYRSHNVIVKKKNKPTVVSNGSKYIGCYKDKGLRDLYRYIGPNYSPQSCKAKCGKLNFKYAAVQNGGICYCGNTYGKYGKAKSCMIVCQSDRKWICGGNMINSVYFADKKIKNETKPAKNDTHTTIPSSKRILLAYSSDKVNAKLKNILSKLNKSDKNIIEKCFR